MIDQSLKTSGRFIVYKTFDIDCELNYQVHTPSTFVFKIEAALTPGQDDHATNPLTMTPALAAGALQRRPGHPHAARQRAARPVQRALSRHGRRACAPSARTLRETEVADLPLDVLPYLSGSRYVESELLFQEALQWIGTFDRGYPRVERICEWVRKNVRYEVGTSMPYGTTRDVLASRTGVCRDYAHVAIALCRALNIPARFVVGHVHVGHTAGRLPRAVRGLARWTAGCCSIRRAWREPGDVIRIGTGHDAADLPFASIFGSATHDAHEPAGLSGAGRCAGCRLNSAMKRVAPFAGRSTALRRRGRAWRAVLLLAVALSLAACVSPPAPGAQLAGSTWAVASAANAGGDEAAPERHAHGA